MIGLQCYSTYSILSGLFEPGVWVEAAYEKGYTALAFTDKFTTASHYQLQKYCKANSIKPIFGIEFEIVSDEDKKDERHSLGYVLLYAKNDVGYKNILKMNYISSLRGDLGDFYNRPKLKLSNLIAHSEGVICIAPSADGVGLKLYAEMSFHDLTPLKRISYVFGEDLYIGINPMYKSNPSLMLKNLACSQLTYQKCFIFGCYYIEASHHELYEVVRQIDRSSSSRILANNEREIEAGRAFLPEDTDLNFFYDGDQYLPQSLIDECNRNNEAISQKCNYLIPTDQTFIPRPDLKGKTAREDVEEIVIAFFKSRFNLPKDINDMESLFAYDRDDVKPYLDRLKYEIDTISSINEDFFSYFHIQAKMCQEHDRHFNVRGPARGSVGGSLLAYALDLTRLDPLKWDTLFERFISPDRPDWPDIDLDFSSEGRDFVKNVYLKGRYGQDSVVGVATYKRLKVKSGIKAIHTAYSGGFKDNHGRIHNYSAQYINELLDIHVPATLRGDKELRYMINSSQMFEEFYERHSDYIENVLMPLQETALNAGIHASATIVTNGPSYECFGVAWNETHQTLVSEIEFEDLEKMGYLKFDLLNIDAISVINYAQDLVKSNHNINFPRYDDLTFDDAKVLQSFAAGDTDGIFQFNSRLQRTFLPEIGNAVNDGFHFGILPLCVALLRTGPMSAGAHHEYLKIVKGEADEHYEFSELKEILGPTNGLLIYQEQVMKIGTDLVGFTKIESNQLRRILAKKKTDEVAAWKERFLDGGLSRGHDVTKLTELWDKIAFFAEYSFNLAHSVGYSILSYYQAYLKTYYPVEYWCATLEYAKTTAKRDDDLYTLKYKAEEAGIKFVFPTIKGFASKFTPAGDNKIYWPLGKVKGMGKAADFLAARGKNFTDLDDFCVYINSRDENGRRPINKKIIAILLDIGFFRPLGEVQDVAHKIVELRWQQALEEKVEAARVDAKKKDKPFDPDKVKPPPKDPLPIEYSTKQDLMYWVKKRNDAFSFEVSKWKDVAPFSEDIESYTEKEFKEINDGHKVFIGGRVTKIFLDRIKKGNKRGSYFATLQIEDGTEKYSVKIWPTFWESDKLARSGQCPMKGDLIEIEATKNIWNDRHQLVVDGDTYLKVVWRYE